MNNKKKIALRKRALITGGAGFLGSHLCERLLNDGYKIFCLDNFFTGKEKNIEHLSKNSDFEVIRQDICNPFFVEVEEIYNLACPASPVHYQADPIGTMKTCVLGVINCLELARKLNAKIFQASTSEVYGDPLMHPQDESYWGNVNPKGIRACYDEGKRCSETLFFDYWRKYNIQIKVGRIFNTYGPRMHPNDGRVISNFIVQALKEDELTIYGNGDQTRSFCYVEDLIEGFVKLMDTTKELIGPINLGNPSEWTIKDLAKKIIQMTNSSSKIKYCPLPVDDPKKRQPNIQKAQTQLLWTPKIELSAGLERTIEYFLKEKSLSYL